MDICAELLPVCGPEDPCAGWMHQVINLQPCLKLAWDVYTKAQMPAYIASWQLIANSIMRHNAEDYMAVGRVLVKAITKSFSVNL